MKLDFSRDTIYYADMSNLCDRVAVAAQYAAKLAAFQTVSSEDFNAALNGLLEVLWDANRLTIEMAKTCRAAITEGVYTY
jgi:hypothetical protein